MANRVLRTFTADGSWTAPAGVTQVTVTSIVNAPTRPSKTSSNAQFIFDPFGKLYGWGANNFGQLALGDSATRSSPVLVVGGLTFKKLVCVNGFSALALTVNNQLYAWGGNPAGQLGLGDVTSRSSPVLVLGSLSFQTMAQMGFGNNNQSFIALDLIGNAYTCGFNDTGQLGVGDVTPRSSPVLVLGGLKFKKVFNSFMNASQSAYALTNAGALYAWGNNGSGQLGNGDLNARSSPVLVLGGLTITDIRAGTETQNAVMALTSTGDLYGWGQGNNGMLGNGDTLNKSSPVLVLGGLKFQAVGNNNGSFFGLTTSGDLYAWGLNTNGQLGVGDVTPRSSPVAVLGGIKFSKIVSCYVANGAAISTSGDLYTWGVNTVGQLGVGDVTPRSSPTLVLGGIKWKDVALDSQNFYGIDTSGNVYSWGANSGFQIGNGNNTPQSSPVLVLGGFLNNIQDTVQRTVVTVVPGTSYAITFEGPSYFAKFDTTVVGQRVDSIQLEYFD